MSFESFIDNPPALKKSGRPKGAKNKRTEMLRRYLAAKGKLPVDVLAGVMLAEDDVLNLVKKMSKELGIKREDALKAVIGSANSLMKVTEQELPKQVDFTGDKVLPLFVMDNSSVDADERPSDIVEGSIVEVNADGHLVVAGGDD